MSKLVSVIIPAYNVKKYLRECLHSVIHQTYKDLEIILVDDGSTDGSGAICEKYRTKDSRIQVIHQKNQGLSAARNTGLKAMHGEIIAFLDSDDAIMPDMEENGYLYWHGKDQNGKLTEGERHISYVRNGIEFELHHHFSSAGFDIDDILEKAFSRRIYKTINGYSIPVFPEIENGLVLLGHINQHLTKDHLGIRQIIDWEMYFYSVMNSENWKQEFTPIAKEIGLFDLAVNVTKMCRKHLGLPDSIELRKHQNPAEDETTDRLLENLLNYGNFGSKQPFASEKSGESIRSVMGIIKNKGLYSYFRDNGLQSWKFCEKYPILRPFAFLYGFFRFCIRGIAGIIKTGDLKEQLQYVRETKKMDSDLGIRTKEAGKGKGAKK